MQRLLIFLLFMAAGTAAVILLTTGEAPLQSSGPVNLPVNVLALQRVLVLQHEGPGVKMEIKAGSAVVNERSRLVELEQVSFRLFDTTGAGEELAHGEARLARVEQGQGTVVLSGNVVLTDEAGVELRSEQLAYEEKTQRITAPGEVVITSAGATHQGRSLVYDLKARTMTLAEPRIFQ